VKQTSLLQTIYNNETDLFEKVRAFVDRGTDLSSVTEYAESPLRVASNNGRFDVVKLLIDSGADKHQLQWTSSFYEVTFGTPSSLRESILMHGDIEHRDFWQRTPWLLSIQVGDIEKAALLLSLGANRHVAGRCNKQPMAYAIQHNNLEMLNWLVENGFDLEATDEFRSTPLITASKLGMTDCVKFLVEHGADIYKENHISERALEVATNLDIVKMLVELGDNIGDVSEETHAMLVGTKVDGSPDVTRQEYLEGKDRQFGVTNPEKANVKFWIEMIKSGASAWQARRINSDKENSSESKPVWCYKRFGRSTTLLDGGSIVEIGGEHEDHYDPDFCIYNDVIVFDSSGNIEIYLYPESMFPPTDFHTATLVDGYIYIIGCLGYVHSRCPEHTPVYRLALSTMKIEKVDTKGESPGWIHKHNATLSPDRKSIVVTKGKIDLGAAHSLQESIDDWMLNLNDFSWEKLTQRNWRRWEIRREDKKYNHLWAIRHALWSLEANWRDDHKRHMKQLEKSLGYRPDVTLVKDMYSFDLTHDSPREAGRNEFCIYIDGVKVRFIEEMHSLQVVVEGNILDKKLNVIKQQLFDKFSALENAPCILEDH